MALSLLRAVFTDDCTYTNEVFCGVFSSPELAESAKKEWIREHGETPDDWIIIDVDIDEVF